MGLSSHKKGLKEKLLRGEQKINLLKERAENYTADEFEDIHSMDAHLVRNLEGYLFSSSGKGRPCTVLGNRGTGKTFNLIKTLRRGVKELEDFLPVMFAFKRTGELEPLSTSLLTPGSEDNLPELERVSNQEAMVMADVIVFDDFHYVCEAVERGEYPSSKLVEFLEDVLNQAKVGKRVVISSADQLSAYSNVIDDRRFDQILLKYGFGKDTDVDALARLEVSSPSLRAWKSIAEGLGIEADTIILRFIHRCDANPRKLVRFASLFEGVITRRKLQRKAKKRMEKLAEEGKVPFSSKFLITLFRLGSLSEGFYREVREREEEGFPLDRMLDRLEERRRQIQTIAEKLSEGLVLPELEEVEEEKWGQDPVYTVSKKYYEGPLGKRVVRERLDEPGWDGVVEGKFLTDLPNSHSKTHWGLDEEIKSEFLDFVENVERYNEFLQDLKRVKNMADEHFGYILRNFDALFERMGSEWFPLNPCRVAFHDILYDSPVTKESFDLLNPYYSKRLSPHEVLDRIAPSFDLPRNVLDDAHEILERAHSKGLQRGKSVEHVVVGSLYTACRKNSLSRPIKEFEEKISAAEELERKFPMEEIFSIYKAITAELDIEVSVPGYSTFAVRLGRKLEVSPKVLEKAVEIVEKAREKNLVSGKSPRGVAAGAVYLSLRQSSEGRTQAEIAKAANVTSVTVRKRYKELKEKLDLGIDSVER